MNSQNNNDGGGIAIVFGLIAAGLMLIGLVVFALACFATFVLTILALLAWNKPITVGKLTLMPEEARSFVYRGLAGAVLVPAFAIFCVIVFDIFIRADALPYLIVGGYMAGSLGIEILMADAAQSQAGVEVLPPQQQVQVREPPRALPQKRRPFEYASWDDEDAGR